MEPQNIDAVVESVNIISRHSAAKNKDYKMLQIKLDNGYAIEHFIDDAVLFMVNQLAKEAKAK